MDRQPRISIGIPVYNGERYLAETVESLLAQTVDEFELFIVDNASTDGTEKIGRHFAACDKRVRFVRNDTNIGAFRNCNKVIRMGGAEFFKLNMADDVCHPELLERSLEIMDAHPDAALTYARAQYIDEH